MNFCVYNTLPIGQVFTSSPNKAGVSRPIVQTPDNVSINRELDKVLDKDVISGMINNEINTHAMIALSIGIAIQNFPEGAIISMPLREEGNSKIKAFIYGFLSGIVEPIASILAILLTYYVSNILPFVLAFAAGAMIYVVVEELIPEANEGKHSNLATIGLAIGFVLMMILDIALG